MTVAKRWGLFAVATALAATALTAARWARAAEAALRWLGGEVAARAAKASAVVNRPPAAGQADVALIDSANGPWLSASHLGGKGLLWHIGGPPAKAAIDSAPPAPGEIRDGVLSLKLPAHPSPQPRLWHVRIETN